MGLVDTFAAIMMPEWAYGDACPPTSASAATRARRLRQIRHFL